MSGYSHTPLIQEICCWLKTLCLAIRHQPIQPLRHQHDYWRPTNGHHLACWWPQNLTFWPFPSHKILPVPCLHLRQQPWYPSGQITTLPLYGSQLCPGWHCPGVNDHLHLKSHLGLPRNDGIILYIASWQSPVHSLHCIWGQISPKGTGASIPPHSCPAPLPLQTNM